MASVTAQTFAALSDPTRARVVEALAKRGMTVNEIVAMFDLSQPTISRHLRVLREAGLVTVEADAQYRVYRIDAGPLREIDRWLDDYRRFWTDKLDDLERYMDETEEQ
jgi:DNA-binding transcriptional ArsR family regulator